MSLNGLDAPQVQEVYNAVLNEAGGWFLLKYVSRDGVELLDDGKGGVSEARAAVAQYEDLSPLYGLIMYRRKKVLIKYVPEGTSRLLQARTTVHLQDVLEKYSPYETMVEISSAEALSDTTLAAAFPLHTAAPSIKSNRLDEITEDGEEPPPPLPDLPEKAGDITLIRSLGSRKAFMERWPSRRSQAVAPQITVDIGKSPVLSQKSSVSRFLVREESDQQSVTQLDAPISDYAPSEVSVQDNASIISGHGELEDTSENTPPILSENDELDFDKYYAELYKPKVKLGPRPVILQERGRRPRTASSPFQPRPVSLLPPGMHVKPAGAGASHMEFPHPPTSNPPSTSLPFLPRPPPIPDDSLYLPRPSSRGSSRSIPTSVVSVKTSKSLMTPEKLRLMKAMELRKKQMRKSTPPEPVPPTIEGESVPAMPSSSEQSLPSSGLPQFEIDKADSGIQMDDDNQTDYGQKEPASSIRDEKVSSIVAPIDQQAQWNNRTPTPSLKLHEPSHIRDPTFVIDSPTLGRVPGAAGTPPRSAALSYLIETSTSEQPRDTMDSPNTRPSMTESRSVSGASCEVTIPDPSSKDAVLQQKRRGWVEPLTVNIDSTHTSEHEHNYLSDDDFLEELQSATFQEARPIMMQRSPASPFFPRRPSARSAQSSQSIMSAVSGASPISIVNRHEPASNVMSDEMNRSGEVTPTEHIATETQVDLQTTVQPPAPELETPAQIEPESPAVEPSANTESTKPLVPRPEEGSLSTSQSLTQSIAPMETSMSLVSEPAPIVSTPDSERADPMAAPHRSNVSSGISKRIQALSEKSIREGSPSTASSSPATLKNSFVNMRKSSLQDSAEPQITERRPASKLSVWPAPSKAPMAQSNVTVNHSANRNSVSVTARIVRQAPDQLGNVSSPTELHHSPLVINHSRGRGAPNHEFPPMAPLLTEGFTPQAEDIVSPEPRDRSLSPTFSHSSVDSGATNNRKSFDRKSFTSKYKSGHESPQKHISKHTSTTSLASDGKSESEKPSRTSRFFKRISTFGGNKRKSNLSPPPPTANPEPRIQVSASSPRKQPVSRGESVPDLPPAIVIGDLNVQFPDTYLWKRRWVEIDNAGNVIFTASRPVSSATNGKPKQAFVTKFHFKELMAPYVPDLDRQEMPHSVLFDLPEGSTLSCASEDNMAQRQLLSLLTTYSQAWS